MKRRFVLSLVTNLALVGAMWVVAHPHINKSVTAKLPSGADATVSYTTVPGNEENVRKAPTGTFLSPRGPKLKLSADVKAGSGTIATGEYTVGVIKNSDKDFTMALFPGTVPRGTSPDMSKVIKLDSQFDTAHGKAEHIIIDIMPGSGKFEGKVVLIIHFGTLHIEGLLT